MTAVKQTSDSAECIKRDTEIGIKKGTKSSLICEGNNLPTGVNFWVFAESLALELKPH